MKPIINYYSSGRRNNGAQAQVQLWPQKGGRTGTGARALGKENLRDNSGSPIYGLSRCMALFHTARDSAPAPTKEKKEEEEEQQAKKKLVSSDTFSLNLHHYSENGGEYQHIEEEAKGRQ